MIVVEKNRNISRCRSQHDVTSYQHRANVCRCMQESSACVSSLSVSPHQSLLLISTSLALITLLFPAEAEL